MTKIGFIGLGTMGGPMASNIIKGGHQVRGFDINQTSIKSHIENGGTNASSPSEAAEDCEFLFTMLPNSQHVKEAIFEKNGAIESLRKGSIVIDMSTIHPFETDGIREMLKLNILNIRPNIDTKSLDSHLSRIRKKLCEIESNVDLVSIESQSIQIK